MAPDPKVLEEAERKRKELEALRKAQKEAAEREAALEAERAKLAAANEKEAQRLREESQFPQFPSHSFLPLEASFDSKKR